MAETLTGVGQYAAQTPTTTTIYNEMEPAQAPLHLPYYQRQAGLTPPPPMPDGPYATEREAYRGEAYQDRMPTPCSPLANSHFWACKHETRCECGAATRTAPALWDLREGM